MTGNPGKVVLNLEQPGFSIKVARRSRHSRLARLDQRSPPRNPRSRLRERLVVVGILQRDNDGLGGQSMANRILRSALFAAFRLGTRTCERITTVGLDLSDRGHG
jgi:hypothetical protein